MIKSGFPRLKVWRHFSVLEFEFNSMPIVSQSVANEVLRLFDSNMDPVEIARRLDLKKIQVTAIIAHRDLKSHSEVANPIALDDSRGNGSSLREPERSNIVAEYSIDVDHVRPPSDIPITAVEQATEAYSGILVGEDLEYGDPLFWKPQDASLVPNPHLMIMGESGSGKTYALQCLMAELGQLEIPSIVFDYGQSFELESLDPIFRKYAKPKEYLLAEEGVSLNPLQIFPNDVHGPKSVATRVSDIFDAVYQLGAIQRKVLIDAILEAFSAAGISSADKASWQKAAPSVIALQEVLEQLSADKEYANSRNAVGLAARLTTFFMLSSFRTDTVGWSWGSVLGDPVHRVHILQFRGLEGKTQRVLVEVLLWHLFFFLKSQGQNRLRLYCVLDEAHHLSFREGGPTDLLLREARKFGIGIVFASQQPGDFSDAAFSNSASKLVFQTTDTGLKVSRFLAAKCANYESPEQIHDLIAVLPRGQAFFITENRGHKLRVADLEKRSTLWGSE